MEDGQKLCGRCKESKPEDAFAPSMWRKRSGWCRECHGSYTREKNGSAPREVIEIIAGQVRCGKCKEYRPAGEFAPSQRKTGGWCRECHRAYYRAKSPALPEGFGTCEYCGQKIEDAKDRRRRFCSANCKTMSAYWRNNPRVERRCETCDADITGLKRNARFCSDQCSTTWHNRNKTPEQRRVAMLWSKYRITSADYDAMAVAQGNRCAICLSDDPRSKHDGIWHVDHCHDSGAVRGLLCSRCNTGIGQLGENVETLARAIDYLNNARENQCMPKPMTGSEGSAQTNL